MRVGKRAEFCEFGRNRPPCAARTGWRPPAPQAARDAATGDRPVAALPDDIAFLADAGVGRYDLDLAAAAVAQNGICAAEILIRRGAIPREDYEARLARHCGVERLSPLPADFTIAPGEDPGVEAAHAICRFAGVRRVAIAPRTAGYDRTALAGMRSPGAFDHCVFVDADDLRHAIFAADRRRRMAFATSDLIRRAPEFSSAHRMSAGQILGAGVLIATGAAGLLLAPQLAYLAVGAVFTAFYLGVVLLRAWLTFRIGALGDRPTAGAAINPEDLPVYSVLIALRDEANQARRLVGALGAIQWPADRLQVLFACEEDDRSTIRALEACNLPRGWRVVACPAGSPKTKPRALTYVLPLVAGEFCVVYDAEDRPHPRQLLEAFSRFHASPDNLACLQAPLLVDNRSPNWLTRMFAMEYRSLFCGQLPVLEAAGGPIPLGGTSNHFRTSILRQSGGWDPYNVTEDADIGIRLARLGHHCGTLRLPTWEEAPRHPGAWMRQRTRWLKGWMQTILVHNRRPMRTLRSLGVKGTILFHLLLGAIVISMISHPLFLAVATFEFAQLARGAAVDPHALALFGLSVFNLVAGYTTHAAFLLAVANRERVRFRWTDIASLPAYWLLISLAGWRAAVQFLLAPFYWEKTAHGLASRQDFAGIAGNPRRRRQFRQPERRSGSNHPWTTYSTRQPQGN